MSLKLGIIGASPNNGHPYSWSAIFNGYDKFYMGTCGYPVISEYLAKQNWPGAKIDSAKVVSIWTQDQKLSEHIAKSTYIDTVSSSLSELGSNVDAILLARDDAENHLQFAKPFLLSGKPIYIDKPIALSKKDLLDLYGLEQYKGQIFTCSALRYSKELILTSEGRAEIGQIVSIFASTPNSWEKYAIHIIEPFLNIISKNDYPVNVKKIVSNYGAVILSTDWKSGLHSELSSLGVGDSSIKIKILGTKGEKELVFQDPFNAFKLALKDYVDGIINKECRSPFDFNLKAVSLIEDGIK